MKAIASKKVFFFNLDKIFNKEKLEIYIAILDS